MPWAKVGDEWWCHPKVMGLPLAPRGLWVSALSWSCAQRKDIVPTGFLALVGGTVDDAAALVDAGLWVPVEGGWRIHDWSEYQSATVSERRAEAGRKGGQRSGAARRERAKQTEPETGADLLEERSKPKQNGFAVEANDEAGPIPALPNPSNPSLAVVEAMLPADPIVRIRSYERGSDDAPRLARRAIGAVAEPQPMAGRMGAGQADTGTQAIAVDG